MSKQCFASVSISAQCCSKFPTLCFRLGSILRLSLQSGVVRTLAVAARPPAPPLASLAPLFAWRYQVGDEDANLLLVTAQFRSFVPPVMLASLISTASGKYSQAPIDAAAGPPPHPRSRLSPAYSVARQFTSQPPLASPNNFGRRRVSCARLRP